MSLGTAYLYNLETNGGNYKHVVARPTSASEFDFDSVTMFTAASVNSRRGTVLLRTAPNTHKAGLDNGGRHPVAIHKEQENVILLGDSSFLRSDRFNVGDNEQFAAFLVEFLISGDSSGPIGGGDDETTDGADGETTDTPNETDQAGDDSGQNNTTSTPSPLTPAADSLAPPTGSATGSVAGTATAETLPSTPSARPAEPVARPD
jgi:hypothetical protein